MTSCPSINDMNDMGSELSIQASNRTSKMMYPNSKNRSSTKKSIKHLDSRFENENQCETPDDLRSWTEDQRPTNSTIAPLYRPVLPKIKKDTVSFVTPQTSLTTSSLLFPCITGVTITPESSPQKEAILLPALILPTTTAPIASLPSPTPSISDIQKRTEQDVDNFRKYDSDGIDEENESKFWAKFLENPDLGLDRLDLKANVFPTLEVPGKVRQPTMNMSNKKKIPSVTCILYILIAKGGPMTTKTAKRVLKIYVTKRAFNDQTIRRAFWDKKTFRLVDATRAHRLTTIAEFENDKKVMSENSTNKRIFEDEEFEEQREDDNVRSSTTKRVKISTESKSVELAMSQHIPSSSPGSDGLAYSASGLSNPTKADRDPRFAITYIIS